ncbi:MAG: SpoIIE family protein phosphatase, partial [Bacteroidia bacterium]
DSIERTESNKSDFIFLEIALEKYKKSNSDTVKLTILSEIIENSNDENIWIRYNRIMYQMADDLAKKEPSVFLKNKFLSKKAQAINNYAYHMQNYANNAKGSLKFYYAAAKIQREIGDKLNLSVSNNNIGNLLYNSGKILEAIDIYHETIAIQEELKNAASLTPLLNNLGEVYLFLGDSVKAYVYIKRALASALQSGDKRIIAQEFQNIGVLAYNRGQQNYAFECVRKALAIREQIGDVNGVCKSKLNLVLFYIKIKNYVLARQYLNEVEPLVMQTENTQIQQLFHFDKAQFYTAINDSSNAIVEFEKSLELSKKTDILQEEIKAIAILIPFYQRTGKKDKELLMYRQLQKINKRVNTTEAKRDALKKEYIYEYTKKESELRIEQALKDEKAKDEKRKQKFITLGISFILLLTLIFSFFIFKAFKISKQKNVIISSQKQEVEKQKHLIEEKQKEIVDSINYAKRIQNALLANEELLNKILPEHFILFKPKDIVSGDFYWANSVVTENLNLFFLAICDSTGHGVPGAFMSLLNTNFLNEAINEKHIYEPNKVFNYARMRLINSISKEEQKDGFDGILICIDKLKNKITYAAANNCPVIVNLQKELTKLPCDKMPVGKGEKNAEFELHTFNFQKGDTLYLYTDGYADQFGGPGSKPHEGAFAGGKKFKYKPLNDLLVSINDVPLNKQSSILDQKFLDWKGGLEQVDDVCIVGLKL